ncbi:cytochrome P450 [Streptomyces sp. NPDC026294]|uniref:cytochrome P450 n=1 Tax=Streptomyces sp. NPDC026294 TaxID=3155362 RepID=UPI0033C4758F
MSAAVFPILSIPDICVPFPAPEPRADAEALSARTIDWGHQHGLIGPRGSARLADTPLLGLPLALAGQAPWNGATVLMDWFLWALVLDDRIDDGPWAADGALEDFTEAVEAIVHGRAVDGAHDPMLAVLAHDLWPRTRRLAAAPGRPGPGADQIRGHLLRHLNAQCELVRGREQSASMGVAEYVTMRRDTFGALFFFDLIDTADGAVQPADPCAEGCLTSLREHAADIIAWTNDIHSVAKDIVLGERFNLVAVLAEERGLDWQSALDTAHDKVAAALSRFTKVRQRHAGHQAAEARPDCPDTDLEAAPSRPARLAQVIRASVDWHASVSRYHLQAETAPGGTARGEKSPAPPSLKSRDFETDPYPLYARLRTEMPVAYDEPTDTWLLSRHADVQSALTDPRFSNENYTWQIGPLLGHTIVSMDGREHAAHRALLTPSFRGRALAALQSSINAVCEALVSRLRGRERVDLITEFTIPLPIQVMAGALGLPAETPEQLRRLKDWCAVGFSYLGNYRQDPALLTGGLRNRDDFYNYLQPYIDERRTRPSDDLISALLAAEVDGQPLSEANIRSCCAILLTAGSETSHGATANLIANLLNHPDVLAAAREDPAELDLALAETLRRNPPLQLVLRQSREAVDLPSGTVPADATIACLIGAANRDPQRFTDPDVFDPHRVDGRIDREYAGAASHFAFGAGRHFCLGAHLARAEITTGIRLLLAEFPNLRWTPGFRPVETGFLNRFPANLKVSL